jgi:hypothetical protein
MIDRKRNDGLSFDEWAALFSGELFVKVVTIYADESGTHDPSGSQAGSAYPIIAGFAAPPSEWSKFCVEWNAVLAKYGVPYFHSREVREVKAAIENNKPSTSKLKRNPYYGWDIKRIDKFLLTLASIAGSGNKVLIQGGALPPKNWTQMLGFERTKL